MSASISIQGMAQLRQALRDLPRRVADETLDPIVRATANGLASEVRSSYPRREGVLADRVVVEHPHTLRAKVRSKAPHAHMYEYGTVQRFTRGTGANRGTMPAQPTFIPATVRWRARMMRQTQAALQRLRVPGFTGSLGARET